MDHIPAHHELLAADHAHHYGLIRRNQSAFQKLISLNSMIIPYHYIFAN